MRVKMLEDAERVDLERIKRYNKGVTYDLPDKVAEELVGRHVAEKLSEKEEKILSEFCGLKFDEHGCI